LVSVIDLKYWWYTAGGVYDPRGGEDLAPRQQLREWKGNKSRSDESIARQVREYRTRYPGKAVVCSLDPANRWAVLAAGGSVPDLPPATDPAVLAALPALTPFACAGLTDRQWALADPGEHYLVYSRSGDTIRLALVGAEAAYSASWVDPKTGGLRLAREAVPAGEAVFRTPGPGPAVLWVTREPSIRP
jgi:hypothetical protein